MTAITSNLSTTGSGAFFSAGDTLTLAADAYVISTVNSGIYMDGSNSDVYDLTVDGIVNGKATDFYCGIFFHGGSKAAISIGETGQVRGDHGVALYGATTLTNDGAISSVNGDGIVTRTTETITIENHGQILSPTGNGIEFDTNSSGNHFVSNSGVITGTSDHYCAILSLNAKAIDAITNSGILNGSIDLGGSNDTMANSGDITGSVFLDDGNDTMTNSGRIDGSIYLGDGKDTFKNGDTADNSGMVSGTVWLQGGNDTFVGGDRADVVSGGVGRDTLTGGGGKDEFVLDAQGKKNADVITDFTHKVDQIYLNDATFKELAFGDFPEDDFKLIANAHSSKGVDHSDRLLYDQAHGNLYYDQDGSDKAHDRTLIAHLGAHTMIDATDFFVY